MRIIELKRHVVLVFFFFFCFCVVLFFTGIWSHGGIQHTFLYDQRELTSIDSSFSFL